MEQEMTDDEIAAAVERIERRHREEVVRIYVGAAVSLMIGLPLVIGLVVLILRGGAVDLIDIGWGMGLTMAVGVAFAGLYWAALKIWARG